jgi:hypothetical protein
MCPSPVRKNFGRRGLCPSHKRSQGRDRVLTVRKKRQRPGPVPKLQRDLMDGCSCELRQVGRDRVPAVRKERQNTGASAEPATTPDGRVALRAPTSREGWRPRRPQEYRAQRTVPLPQGSHGRDRVLAVRKKRQTTVPAADLQRDSIGRCPCELRQVGRDGVPAVRNQYRARRTAPLPDIVQPWASFDIGQPGRDRVPAVSKNISHLGPCPSGAIATLLDAVRNRPGRDGPHPGGPQGKAEHGRLCGTCNHTRWPGALASSDRSGRDGVPAVRRNIGHRGLCPSHKVPMGGAASLRSARKGRPRAPLRNLQPHPMAGCPCAPRQVGEGRRPRRPQECRAQGTVPLPQGPMGGTVSPRSARKGRTRAPLRNLQPHPMAGWPCELRQVGEGRRPRRPQSIPGAKDCAPPGHSPTVGILRHWPAREGPRPRGPQELMGTGDRAPPGAQPRRCAPCGIGQAGMGRILAAHCLESFAECDRCRTLGALAHRRARESGGASAPPASSLRFRYPPRAATGRDARFGKPRSDPFRQICANGKAKTDAHGSPESLASRWGGVSKGVFESEESLDEIWEGSGAHRGGVVRAPEGPQGRARVVFFQDAGMLRPGRQGRSSRAGFGPWLQFSQRAPPLPPPRPATSALATGATSPAS